MILCLPHELFGAETNPSKKVSCGEKLPQIVSLLPYLKWQLPQTIFIETNGIYVICEMTSLISVATVWIIWDLYFVFCMLINNHLYPASSTDPHLI